MTHLLRTIPLAAGLLALTTASIHAQSSFGVGGVLCSQYIKAARSSDILYHQASNWLLGYVSGMNAGLKAANAPASTINLSNDQVLKSAGDYCAAHPASTIANAANEWYPSLPRQAEPAPKRGLTLDLDTPSNYRPLIDRR